MIDFKVNANNELVFQDGQLLIVSDLEAVQQGLRQKLHHIKGEYFLDKFYGLDFFYVITNKKVSKESVDAHIKKQILDYPGVISITGYTSVLNKTTRHLEINIKEIKCISGAFVFSGVI